MTSFQQLNLHPDILKALETCGYTTPTPIQAKSIPEILAGRDVVASAQTGTGKTAAFVLPALHKLSETGPQKKPRVLILTPTRELATQIMEAVKKYGKFSKFYTVNLVGGMNYHQQVKTLTRPLDIIVATPGRLMDHMQNRRIDLSNIEMLVLDEADRMLDMGFIDDVKIIAKATPASRQTLLFSATFDKKIATVVKQLLKDPARVDFSGEALSPKKISQQVYYADNPQHKTKLLEHLLEQDNIFKAIIFTATKRGADQLADALKEDGFSAAALHGDLKQAARNRTVEKMRQGKIQYLVATDVAARGIDISDITHVINYDIPKFSEDYVHRIGRTGRAGKEGIALSLVLPNERRHLKDIENYTKHKIEEIVVAGLEPTNKGFNAAPARKSNGRPPARRGQSRDRNDTRAYGRPERSFSERAPSRFEDSGARKPRRFADDAAPRFDAGARKPRRFADDAAPRSGTGDTRARKPRHFEEKSPSSFAEGTRFSRDDRPAPRGDRRPSGNRFANDTAAPRSDRKPRGQFTDGAARSEAYGENKKPARRGSKPFGDRTRTSPSRNGAKRFGAKKPKKF